MRGRDNQMVLPSYLMKVRQGWTGVGDMFEEVQHFELGDASRRALQELAALRRGGLSKAGASRALRARSVDGMPARRFCQ